MTPGTQAPARPRPFRHEALLYAGDHEFVESVGAFILAGEAAGEPIMVMVEERKIDLLRSILRDHAQHVVFEDMLGVGRNPARIIPAWTDFVADNTADGRSARGIGEPVWPQRGPAELAECVQHEQLLNTALADAAGFTLLCPYDTAALDERALDAAHTGHRTLLEGGMSLPSPGWSSDNHGEAALAGTFSEPFPPPEAFTFEADGLRELRSAIAREAQRAGLTAHDVEVVLLAANEVATNSVRHGGGRGRARVWSDEAALVCEVHDDGHITDPLAGRHPPDVGDTSGRGLWLANQLCDLVQVRSSSTGTTVRLHVNR